MLRLEPCFVSRCLPFAPAFAEISASCVEVALGRAGAPFADSSMSSLRKPHSSLSSGSKWFDNASSGRIADFFEIGIGRGEDEIGSKRSIAMRGARPLGKQATSLGIVSFCCCWLFLPALCSNSSAMSIGWLSFASMRRRFGGRCGRNASSSNSMSLSEALGLDLGAEEEFVAKRLRAAETDTPIAVPVVVTVIESSEHRSMTSARAIIFRNVGSTTQETCMGFEYEKARQRITVSNIKRHSFIIRHT